MLYQAILFVVAKSALAHRSHDNPKIELFGSAPYSVKNGTIPDNFKVVGCLGKDMLYVGLSPKTKERSEKIKAILDAGIQKLQNSGKLKSIFGKYGIPMLENNN
jgi:ABC-type amino acid transport substrate-binding protein